MTAPTPRPHQVDALADLVRAFAVHDRVQLVMAFGTGKTLVGRWHAEASETRHPGIPGLQSGEDVKERYFGLRTPQAMVNSPASWLAAIEQLIRDRLA